MKLKVGDYVTLRKDTIVNDGTLYTRDVIFVIMTTEKIKGDFGKKRIYYLANANGLDVKVLAVSKKEIKHSNITTEELLKLIESK